MKYLRRSAKIFQSWGLKVVFSLNQTYAGPMVSASSHESGTMPLFFLSRYTISVKNNVCHNEQFIHLNRIFHYKPFWGSPIYGNPPILMGKIMVHPTTWSPTASFSQKRSSTAIRSCTWQCSSQWYSDCFTIGTLSLLYTIVGNYIIHVSMVSSPFIITFITREYITILYQSH